LPAVRHAIAIGAVGLVLVGCGSEGLRGSLEWSDGPSVTAHSARGVVRNTTGHTVELDARALRLLDADGRKVAGGRFSVARPSLEPHATTSLEARWRSGKPVRIDYGSGALAIPSP
jgi:hypothetical protein